ncbi:MAG TPA: ribonuclease H-like domain-containing protein [Candidatus Solibacter sp.]|nr:ribonuclease H-like domain-containing protein [Candidatus Solibacter sp.]
MKVAYLDIETDYTGTESGQSLFEDYKNHLITVLGVRVVNGERDEFTQLIDPNISRTALLMLLEGVERIITYNGRSIPDKMKGRIGFDFPVISARLGVVLDREFEHTDLVPECWSRGLYGGQKKVEQTLGLERKLPGRDGAWATQMWRRYKETGQRKPLQELLIYNKEDVFMLREIQLKLEKR